MLRVAKVLLLVSVLLLMALLLSGCASIITSAEGGPSAPVEQLDTVAGSGKLPAIDVQHVQVEVGVGSPIPVEVMVSGGWPGLCAQLAQVTMTQGDFSFDYELLATPEEEGCPPDNVGLPFAFRIPLNVVELQEGTYTVTVNGVSTSFDAPVTSPSGP